MEQIFINVSLYGCYKCGIAPLLLVYCQNRETETKF